MLQNPHPPQEIYLTKHGKVIFHFHLNLCYSEPPSGLHSFTVSNVTATGVPHSPSPLLPLFVLSGSPESAKYRDVSLAKCFYQHFNWEVVEAGSKSGIRTRVNTSVSRPYFHDRILSAQIMSTSRPSIDKNLTFAC